MSSRRGRQGTEAAEEQKSSRRKSTTKRDDTETHGENAGPGEPEASNKTKGGREKRKASILAASAVFADTLSSGEDISVEEQSKPKSNKKGSSDTKDNEDTTEQTKRKKPGPKSGAKKGSKTKQTSAEDKETKETDTPPKKNKGGRPKKRPREGEEGSGSEDGEESSKKSKSGNSTEKTKAKKGGRRKGSGKATSKKEGEAYRTASKTIYAVRQRSDSDSENEQKEAGTERKQMHDLADMQSPSREQTLEFIRILARQPSSTIASIENIRCQMLKIHQENYSGPVRRRHTRDLVGTDKRFCSPVLFTAERPAPNRNMWMGPPVPPSTTSVKEEIPQVLQAAREQEPTETTKQKSSKQKGAKDGRKKRKKKSEQESQAEDGVKSSDQQDDDADEEASDEQDPRLLQVEPQFEMPRPQQLEGLDDYLDFVGKTYYPDTEKPVANEEFVYLRRTCLGMLCTQLRPPMVIDKWAPYEIAVFESAICLFGKDFSKIASLIKTKTATEVDEFFYVWKMSKNYLRWRQAFKHPELPFKSS